MLHFLAALGALSLASPPPQPIGPEDFVCVSADGWNFEVVSTGDRFVPFGANMVFSYPGPPHHQGLTVLVQEEWDPETVRRVVRAAAGLNMNTLKVFLPSDKVLPDPQPPQDARIGAMSPPLFDRLDFLFDQAREHGVYISLTLAEWGMHSLDWWQEGGTFLGRPGAEPGTHDAHATLRAFWRAVARRYRDEPALFSYNLAVEFYMPGGNWGAGQPPGHDYLLNDRWGLPAWHEWLGLRHGGIDAVNEAWGTSYESMDDVPQPEIVFEDGAYTMPRRMIADYNSFKEYVTYHFLRNATDAIRAEDSRHMVTCGFHPHQPGANWMGAARFTAGIAGRELDFLDYLTTHYYSNPSDNQPGLGVPERAYRFATLNARFFHAGKPVIIEEMGHVVKDPVETRDGTVEFVRRFVGHASGFMLWFMTDLPAHEIHGPLDTDLGITDYGRAWKELGAPGGLVAELPRERAPAATVIKLNRTEGLAPVEETMAKRLQEDWSLVEQPVDFDWPLNPTLPRDRFEGNAP